MPVPAPVPPVVFRDMLVACGYRQAAEDEDNWAMVKSDAEHPVLIVPKDGDVISITVMMSILDKLKMDNATYFGLIAQVQRDVPPSATNTIPITPA